MRNNDLIEVSLDVSTQKITFTHERTGALHSVGVGYDVNNTDLEYVFVVGMNTVGD